MTNAAVDTIPKVAPPPGSSNRVGHFWWEDNLCKKKRTRLEKIHEYYDETCLRDVLLPVITKQDRLSLRALDWLVTNYSKKVPIVYNAKPPDCPEVVVNVYRSYKSWLWNHKRKNFDPFRRGKRIFFELDDVIHESTVGQLNFFFWASRYGVLHYARQHIVAIEKDQAEATKNAPVLPQQHNGRKRKRRQLSQAPREAVFVFPTTITVVFNPEMGPSI
jgi:hypothetical protein